MNNDLREVYERLGKLYETEREEMPVLDEFILEYRWFMCADTRGWVSQCLRVGKEKSPEAYQAVLSKELGKPVNQVIENFFAADDETLREPLVALLNLMSKPFNTAERLSEQGIVREPGLQFPYDVSGKKVGIIGYGLYNQFFLGKCKEFHAFDLRPEKGLLNYRCNPARIRGRRCCRWILPTITAVFSRGRTATGCVRTAFSRTEAMMRRNKTDRR